MLKGRKILGGPTLVLLLKVPLCHKDVGKYHFCPKNRPKWVVNVFFVCFFLAKIAYIEYEKFRCKISVEIFSVEIFLVNFFQISV